MKHFPSYYQNACGYQTFQGGDILRGGLTHKYVWYLNRVVLWGHMIDKIYISTCRRCINTTLGKVNMINMTLWSSDQREVCLKNLYFPFSQGL